MQSICEFRGRLEVGFGFCFGVECGKTLTFSIKAIICTHDVWFTVDFGCM